MRGRVDADGWRHRSGAALSWAFFIPNEYEHRVMEIRRRVLIDRGSRLAGADGGRVQRAARCPARAAAESGRALRRRGRSVVGRERDRQRRSWPIGRRWRMMPGTCRRCASWRAPMRRKDAVRLAQQYLQRAAALQPGDAGVVADLNELVPPEVTGGPLTPVWQALAASGPLTSGAPTGMAVENGVIYVAYEDGAVKALDAATGALRWESKLPGRASSAPAAGWRAGPGRRRGWCAACARCGRWPPALASPDRSPDLCRADGDR